MLRSLERVETWKIGSWLTLVILAVICLIFLGTGVKAVRSVLASGLDRSNIFPLILTTITLTCIAIMVVVLLIIRFIEWYFHYYWTKRDRYVVELMGGDRQSAFAFFEPKGSPRDGQIGKWQKGCMVIINPGASNGVPYWIKEEVDQRRYVELGQKANAVELKPQLVFANPQEIGVWLNRASEAHPP